ncbi:MAG: CDP-diacylglycerol--serine O-phosphatidyltransferase [Bdellovibrionales bacterium]|nr:CDP-diacylglycerol--serine O-phosphatidyltransferase [Bdellovibrionales bacterium]
MKRVYILPNLITTANIVCGFLSMVHAFKGDFVRACWFIVISAVCDSLDGRIARFARATSPFGVQYDSLSDLTSFGIAPAILLFCFSLHDYTRFGAGISALYLVCAALRLARFNVSAESPSPSQLQKIRKGYFQGLPSPASAGLIVTMVLMQLNFGWFNEVSMQAVCAVLGGGLGLLMVSNIPFPSFKEVNWRAKGQAWVILAVGLGIVCLFQAPDVTLFCIGYTYLFFGLGWSAYICHIRDKKIGGPRAGEV